MGFEEMFYNRTTQNCAWSMFTQQKTQLLKSGFDLSDGASRVNKGEGMKLRSADSPGTSSASRSLRAVPNCDDDVKTEAEIEGCAMVNELISRYETNKKKELLGEKPKVEKKTKKDSFLESFDEDDDILWDNLDSEPNAKSDFLKYTVPQYDLKLKLYNMHKEKIENMSARKVGKLCRKVIPQLKDIMNETISSVRHQTFKECGINRQRLREMTVAQPFSSFQDYKVMSVIEEEMLADRDPAQVNGELMHYVTNVLAPEALIRIYALANKIPVDLAEKELRYQAGYDGTLSEEIISTIKEDIKENINA